MLAEIIRRAIEETGKPVYQVAREAGVAQQVLSRFMTGKQSITIGTADKLFVYLKMRIEENLTIQQRVDRMKKEWSLTEEEVEDLLL